MFGTLICGNLARLNHLETCICRLSATLAVRERKPNGVPIGHREVALIQGDGLTVPSNTKDNILHIASCLAVMIEDELPIIHMAQSGCASSIPSIQLSISFPRRWGARSFSLCCFLFVFFCPLLSVFSRSIVLKALSNPGKLYNVGRI